MVRYFDAFPHYEKLVRARLEAEEEEGTREVIEYRLKDERIERTVRSIRQHYIDRFIHEAARLRAEQSERVYTETALRRADGEIAREGHFQLGMRVDAVIPAEGKTVRIDSVSVLRFEPTRVQIDSIDIELRPFQWDWCVLTMECDPKRFSFAKLVEWFDRWFDSDDEKLPNDEGVCGIVHFLDEPGFSAGRVAITADLGSAPIDAFYGLLDACAASEPKYVWVSNELIND